MIKNKRPDQHNTKQKAQGETPDNKKDKTTQENSSAAGQIEGETPNKEDQPAGTESAGDEVLAEEIYLDEKLAEMQDKYLRLSAEFDNYRRRTLREKMELSKYAGETILLNILPLIDDFERALSHMDTATECASMKEGIDLIYAKLIEFLKQSGVKEIESLNSDFNVDLHHAVAKKEVKEKANKGKIVEVIQKGYYLQDKVLRHSKVVVGE
jgi:molecular chaperone GrpE